MRVVQINSVCGSGSTGNICVDLSRRMSEWGIENKIFYAIGHTDYPLAEKFGNMFDVRLHQMGTRILGGHGFYSRRSTRILLQRIDEFAPDAVHLHNLHGHYLNVEMLMEYLREKGVSVIWTFHDCWPMTGHCAHFDYIGCKKWKTGCYGCGQLRTYPTTFLFDCSRRNWLRKREAFTSLEHLNIVAVSDWMKKRVKVSYFQKYPVHRIYNVVDTNVFRRRAPERDPFYFADGYVILGMAGKWLESRNEPFLNAIHSAVLNRPGISLVLVGCDRGAHPLLCAKNIFCLPKTSTKEKMADYFNRADVFVNLSQEDSFGLVNAEAMACGTPVIAFRNTASGEVVGPGGDCGLLMDRDPDSACNAILWAKERGKEYYTANCINRVQELFISDVSYQKYRDLYHFGEKS